MEMTRGDTHIIRFQRKDANGKVIETKVKEMYFTLRKNEYSDLILIKKKLDEGITFDEKDFYYRVEIDPKDTDDLDYGSYFYDVEVITDDYTKTIKKDYIEITKESTRAKDRW